MAWPNCNTYVLNQCMHNINPTVNSEIFARVLFSRNFAYAKFRKNKTLAKSLCQLLIYVNHALVETFILTNILLQLFAKIKFSRKFSNFQFYINTSPAEPGYILLEIGVEPDETIQSKFPLFS